MECAGSQNSDASPFTMADVTTLNQIIAVLLYGVYLFLTVTRGKKEEAKEKQINHTNSGLKLR